MLAIPVKKATRPLLGYLTEAELAHVLAQMDRTTMDGERDYVLLALLYDTGACIQELLDLTPSDVRLVPPAVARLHGKGRRERLCPLLPQTARLESRYLARVARPLDDRTPLFRNRYGQPLKRHGARCVFMKYIDRARASTASLRRSGISPHTRFNRCPRATARPCAVTRPAWWRSRTASACWSSVRTACTKQARG